MEPRGWLWRRGQQGLLVGKQRLLLLRLLLLRLVLLLLLRRAR